MEPHRRLLVVWLLGMTQIIGYGTLYYSFSVLAPSMAADFGWSPEGVYGLFSLALLAGGVVAPSIGKAFDRAGAGRVMALGSALAALAFALCAFAQGAASFALGIVAIEMVSTLVLYEAAFALLVRLDAARARGSITHLTLIAGFASTIFWPATSMMQAVMSWREIFMVFAALNLGVCLPVHLWLAHLPAGSFVPSIPAIPVEDGRRPAFDILPAADQPRAFLLLLVAFSIGGFVMSALLVHMVPLLAALGMGGSSALVGAVFGPAQVFSRIAMMMAGSETRPLHLAMISSALPPLAILTLVASAPFIAGALAFAALFGLGSGLTSIVRGITPLALFGQEGYGSRVGQLTGARLVLAAVAPFAFAVVLHRSGPTTALVGLCVVGLAGLVCLAEIERMRRAAR